MTNERRVLVHPDKASTRGLRRGAIHHEDARHPRRAGGGTRRAHRRLDGRCGARGRRRITRAHIDRLVARALLVGRRALGARPATPSATTSRRASPCSTTSTCPRRTCTRSRPPSRALDLDEAADAYAAELAAARRRRARAPDLRHHVPRRRTRRPHRVAVPAPLGHPGHRPHGDRRAQLAQAAARAAQPHAPGDQLVAARSGSCWPAPTRPRRSDSPSPARAATRCRSPASRAVAARCSSSTRCRGRGARDRSSRATTDRATTTDRGA